MVLKKFFGRLQFNETRWLWNSRSNLWKLSFVQFFEQLWQRAIFKRQRNLKTDKDSSKRMMVIMPLKEAQDNYFPYGEIKIFQEKQLVFFKEFFFKKTILHIFIKAVIQHRFRWEK